MAEMFEGAGEKSRRFSEHYGRFAEKYGCEYFDASTVIVSSDVDGIHLDATEHRKLGEAITACVEDVFH
jgi:lysophospholipase L1-like esterase